MSEESNDIAANNHRILLSALKKHSSTLTSYTNSYCNINQKFDNIFYNGSTIMAAIALATSLLAVGIRLEALAAPMLLGVLLASAPITCFVWKSRMLKRLMLSQIDICKNLVGKASEVLEHTRVADANRMAFEIALQEVEEVIRSAEKVLAGNRLSGVPLRK